MHFLRITLLLCHKVLIVLFIILPLNSLVSMTFALRIVYDLAKKPIFEMVTVLFHCIYGILYAYLYNYLDHVPL
jgi:hypothetical protein